MDSQTIDVKALEAESTEGNAPSQQDLQDISREYEGTLEIPTANRPKQIVICPVGLVGSGKTTVVRPLSQRLGLLRISTDEIRHILKDHGFNYGPTRDIAKDLIVKYARQGYSLAIDADCAGSIKELVAEFQKNLRITPIWLHINPPESYIIHKLKGFKHTWLFRDGDQAVKVYMERKPLHEHLDMPFLYTFDTSRPDLPQQIDEAVKLIEQV